MVDTDVCKLDKVSNTGGLISMQRNADCVKLLLQNLLLAAVTVLFLLCFPTAQTLLLFALLPTVHPRLLHGILAQVALVVGNSRASAVYEYYVSIMLASYMQAIQVASVPTSCNNIELCHASIDLVPDMSRSAKDGRPSEQAEERASCCVPNSESQIVQHPNSLKQLRLGLNNVANTLKDEKNGKSHKRSGSKQHVGNHMKEDKENEVPNQVASSIRRPGLKPLTLALTNPLSPRQTGHTSGTRPAVARVKGERRRSSVFYVSAENQEPSTPVKAIPMQNIMAETSLLRQIDDLSGRLDEERNLVAKLCVDVEDLQCQVRSRDDEVVQCQRQAMDLLAAVDARGCIIRVLCANIAVLQQREVAWNQATWLNQYRKLISEMRWEEQYKLAEQHICKLSLQVEMAELGHRWIFARFKEQLRIELKTRLESSKSSRVASEETPLELPCAAPSIGNGATISKDSGAMEIRAGSSFDGTIKPTLHSTLHDPLKISPTSSEQTLNTTGSDEATSNGNRTIGAPSLPLSPPAMDLRRAFTVPHPYAIIYEVDSRAPAAPHSVKQAYTNLTTANHTTAEDVEYTSPSQTHIHDYRLQKDSAFYAVPQSAFVLPVERSISPSE